MPTICSCWSRSSDLGATEEANDNAGDPQQHQNGACSVSAESERPTHIVSFDRNAVGAARRAVPGHSLLRENVTAIGRRLDPAQHSAALRSCHRLDARPQRLCVVDGPSPSARHHQPQEPCSMRSRHDGSGESVTVPFARGSGSGIEPSGRQAFSLDDPCVVARDVSGPRFEPAAAVVPLWYRLIRPMCPDRPGPWTRRTIRALTDASTPAACRLGAERSRVQIPPPRLRGMRTIGGSSGSS